MRVVHVLWLFVQTIVLAEAAKIKWTLHKSCYKTKDGSADDNELATVMINAVRTAKAWAKNGATKLEQSADHSPFHGTAVKEAVRVLLGSENYRERAKEVKARFDRFEKLEGPIGRNGDDGGLYDQSQAWKGLSSSNRHHLNFLLVCRPEIVEIDSHKSLGLLAMYDVVRGHELHRNHYLERFLQEENDPGQWQSLPNRVKAITMRDSVQPVENGRMHYPETINFHPLWIQSQRERGFEGWSRQLFREVTAENAMDVFRAQGQERDNDVRPVDGLLETSVAKTVLHEMFHLTAFGGLYDQGEQPYGWVSNVRNSDTENPDLLAIIAVVIELLSRDGHKYKVSRSGVVSRR